MDSWYFAVSCGNAQLYVSSRTAYSLALQGKAPNFSHTAIDLEYLIMRYYLQDHLDYWHSLALMNRQQWFSKILPV